MGYIEIRDAIQDVIDDNLTKVVKTSYKVHKRTPENVIDAHGYSIIVVPPTGAFSPTSTSQYTEAQTWAIDVYSPNAGTSWRSEHEDRLLAYADAIVTIFTNRRILTGDGIRGVQMVSARFNDGDFPINANAVKYHFRLTIVVEFSRARIA